MSAPRDPTLDPLLELHDQILVISPDGYWVKFEVRQVPVTAARPHGLSYSLTLHDPQNRRIMASITLTVCQKRSLVQRMIIDIFASGSSRTSTQTPRRYWKIFGQQSRR